MKYYFLELIDNGLSTRHILSRLSDGGVQTFPDIETNTGPERQAYLDWVAKGNTAKEWAG